MSNATKRTCITVVLRFVLPLTLGGLIILLSYTFLDFVSDDPYVFSKGVAPSGTGQVSPVNVGIASPGGHRRMLSHSSGWRVVMNNSGVLQIPDWSDTSDPALHLQFASDCEELQVEVEINPWPDHRALFYMSTDKVPDKCGGLQILINRQARQVASSFEFRSTAIETAPENQRNRPHLTLPSVVTVNLAKRLESTGSITLVRFLVDMAYEDFNAIHVGQLTVPQPRYGLIGSIRFSS